jgi:hypothetical protein
VLRDSGDGDNAEQLGNAVAERLLRRGGEEILREVYGEVAAAPQQP